MNFYFNTVAKLCLIDLLYFIVTMREATCLPTPPTSSAQPCPTPTYRSPLECAVRVFISLFSDDPVMPIIFKKEDLQLRLFGITDLLT